MMNAIICKKTGIPLATKLGGGVCVCDDKCIMEKELGPKWEERESFRDRPREG